MADRKELIVLAKLARELGRPGDMWNYMSQLVALVHEQQQELDWDERNQLSVAFKTHTEQQRTALSKLAARARKQKEAEQLAATDKYKQMLLEELVRSFSNALALVDNHLLPAATNSKARVYALKLRADCCRYWAEETAGENKRELAERSQYAYQQAWELALKDLHSLDPLRLGVAVNFSVFHADILHAPSAAAAIAMVAYDTAQAELMNADEAMRSSSSSILDLLSTNIDTWSEADEA